MNRRGEFSTSVLKSARGAPSAITHLRTRALRLRPGVCENSLLRSELLLQARAYSAPALGISHREQPDVADAPIVPAVVVRDRIQANTFDRHPVTPGGAYFTAHVMQPVRLGAALGPGFGDHQGAAVALV